MDGGNLQHRDYGRWRPYLEQRASWPDAGRHILAHYDEDSIIVYQAYRPSIGRWIVERQRFDGEWSRACAAHRHELLETPDERVYPVADRTVAKHLGLAE